MGELNRYPQYDDRNPVAIAQDFKKNSIFDGEECYEIEGVYVFEDDLKEYIELHYGKPKEVKGES